MWNDKKLVYEIEPLNFWLRYISNAVYSTQTNGSQIFIMIAISFSLYNPSSFDCDHSRQFLWYTYLQ